MRVFDSLRKYHLLFIEYQFEVKTDKGLKNWNLFS